VQLKWSSTGPAAQAALVADVTRLIGEQGAPVSSHFPMINKIVELRMIGRRRGSV
jgi:hypothetical protein